MAELMSLDDALSMSREDIVKYHKEYLNSALVQLMGLIDFTRSFVRAEGTRVWDDEGNEYLDFLGAYGAMNIGHNHPKVFQAMTQTFGKPNLLQAALSPLPAVLAHNLAQVTPGGLKHSFFCNSGAEAVEGALKLVRIATGKEPVIYCKGAFHGKSFGALSVTGREKYQKPFAPLLHNFSSVPYDDLEALEEALKLGGAAAVILEPIQGEGGIIIPSDGYMRGVRELCDKYNTYMIVDEIQTGFGRTGYMFACEKEGVEPDVMCVAKSLGGGVMPIGAYITTEELWNKAYGSVEKCLLHTSTFGGNAMATSAGIAALEVIINNDLPQKAKENGEYFIGKLRELKEKYPIIRDVRGMGLMIGLEFEEPVKKGSLAEKLGGKFLNKLSGEYMGALIAGELLNKHHIITAYTLNNPNVIRLEPPLTVCRQDLDKVLEALEEIFQHNSGLFSLAFSGGKNMLGRVFKK